MTNLTAEETRVLETHEAGYATTRVEREMLCSAVHRLDAALTEALKDNRAIEVADDAYARGRAAGALEALDEVAELSGLPEVWWAGFNAIRARHLRASYAPQGPDMPLREPLHVVPVDSEPRFPQPFSGGTEPPQVWIPVSERLPALHEYVIATFPYPDGPRVGMTGRDSKRWISDIVPVAWMPLPPPYPIQIGGGS
jgi:hypothetical protein